MSRIGWERPEDREDLPDDRGLRGRLFFLRIFMVIILGGLLYRVIWLQQTQGQDLQAQAQENRFAVLTTNPRAASSLTATVSHWRKIFPASTSP